jgi:hypothetical protein
MIELLLAILGSASIASGLVIGSLYLLRRK